MSKLFKRQPRRPITGRRIIGHSDDYRTYDTRPRIRVNRATRQCIATTTGRLSHLRVSRGCAARIIREGRAR